MSLPSLHLKNGRSWLIWLIPICLLGHIRLPAVEPRENSAEAPVVFYPGFQGYTRTVTTTSPEAQQLFNQGIQLLYGFNHDEAIRSFEQAAELDPDCGMAWWGSAYARGLHINNPVMGDEQSRMAFEAAQRALAAINDESPAEQAMIRAVAERYTWPAPEDRTELDERYAAAMEQAWHLFPNDPDVGALYAESLMNLQPWDLWTPDAAPKGRVMEILATLERTLANTPRHPGANHFYIHAIEASPWPERGLDAADRLQNLVPGSGHLVHMPSHIYIRVGRYADAVQANERAIQADENYFANAPEPAFYNVYFMHNLHFLAYAAMMEARYEVALSAARKIERLIPEEFLKANVELADGFMPTALLVMLRFGRWQEILAEPEPEAWQHFSRAEYHFARAVALAALGDTAQGRRELELLDLAAAGLTDEWKMGNNSASQVIEIARTMAEGELAYRDGEADQAFVLLRQAVDMEEQLQYDEPPGWMQPVRHALGALLLAEGHFSQAEQVYRADLARHPDNAWSLLGLSQALESQGKTDEAHQLGQALSAAWARADVPPVASCYCHPKLRAQ